MSSYNDLTRIDFNNWNRLTFAQVYICFEHDAKVIQELLNNPNLHLVIRLFDGEQLAKLIQSIIEKYSTNFDIHILLGRETDRNHWQTAQFHLIQIHPLRIWEDHCCVYELYVSEIIKKLAINAYSQSLEDLREKETKYIINI